MVSQGVSLLKMIVKGPRERTGVHALNGAIDLISMKVVFSCHNAILCFPLDKATDPIRSNVNVDLIAKSRINNQAITRMSLRLYIARSNSALT